MQYLSIYIISICLVQNRECWVCKFMYRSYFVFVLLHLVTSSRPVERWKHVCCLMYFSYILIPSPSMHPVKRRLLLLFELLELRLLHLFGMVDTSSESRWKHTAASEKYDPLRMFFPVMFQASSQQKLSKNLKCLSSIDSPRLHFTTTQAASKTTAPCQVPAMSCNPAPKTQNGLLGSCEHVSNCYQSLPENLSLNFTGYPHSALSEWSFKWSGNVCNMVSWSKSHLLQLPLPCHWNRLEV